MASLDYATTDINNKIASLRAVREAEQERLSEFRSEVNRQEALIQELDGKILSYEEYKAKAQ